MAAEPIPQPPAPGDNDEQRANALRRAGKTPFWCFICGRLICENPAGCRQDAANEMGE